jgi:NAD(P)-dependent dehydrogenase (short-subunit alcohol dehydrogenase family)
MSSFEDLAGRRAVVTGAAQGIGLAIAKRLIEADVEVVAVDRAGDRLTDSLGWTGCKIVQGDIRLGTDLAERVLDEGGGAVDLIVNNVGISTEHGFLDLKEHVFDEVYETNVRGPFFFTQRLVRELRLMRLDTAETERPSSPIGSILFISSVHESTPSYRLHYDMTKAAISAMVRNLALSLGKNGIRVNAIAPGWIRTNPDPTSNEQREKERQMLPCIPLGRPGVPDDVAKLAVHVLSTETGFGYTSGQTVVPDGGLGLGTWMSEP